MVSTRTPHPLQERLIDFASAACDGLRHVPRDIVGVHIARQLVRSATSPAANYAEALAAESRRDFVHKLQVALKELRESWVWLRLAQRRCSRSEIGRLVAECDELIAIFVKSVTTAKARRE